MEAVLHGPCVRVGFVSRLLLALIGLAGSASLFYFVRAFGTNVPIGDDWDLLRTILAWRTDGMTAASLFAFHNEHRIVATRLVDGALIQLFHGNLRIVMLCNATLVMATLGVFFSFIRKAGNHPLFLLFSYATTVCLAVGWFQWQNFLWSFQFPWLLLPLLLVASIWCLCYVRNNALCGASTILLFVIALACQANGVLVMLSAVPAAWARMQGRSLRVRQLVPGAVVALALAAGYLYFADLPAYVARPGLTAPLAQPGHFAHFYFAALGSPFSAPLSLLGPEPWFGTIVGSVAFGAAVLLLTMSWRSGWAPQRSAMVVLALGLLIFSSGSIFAIALGRFVLFTADAIESRYTTFALYFYVGIVLLFHSLIARDLPIGRRTGLLRSAFLLICFLTIVGSTWGDRLFMRMGLNLKLAQLRYKASLNLSQALPGRPELALQTHTVPPDQLQALLASLEREHLWVPGRITTLQRSALQNEDMIGNVDEVLDRGDRLVLRGWSRLPDGLPADAIVTLVSSGADALVPVAMSSSERIARPDVVAQFGPQTLLGSGWSMEVTKADYARAPLITAYSAARNVFFVIPFHPASISR